MKLKPEKMWRGEFYDELILHYSVEGCSTKGKDVFVDFNLEHDAPHIYLHPHGNPICEQSRKQVKEDVDEELERVGEIARTEWCPNCIKCVPKDSAICPECGAVVSRPK